MVFTFQLLVSFTASTASMYSVFAGIYSATQCQQRDTERGRAREEETGRGTVDAQRNHRPTGERGNERDGDPRWERRSVSRSGNIYLRWTDNTWGCSAVCKNCRDRRGTRAYLLNLSSRSVFHYPPRFERPDRLGIVYLLCEKGSVSMFQLVVRTEGSSAISRASPDVSVAQMLSVLLLLLLLILHP